MSPDLKRLCEIAKAADPVQGTPLAIDDGAAEKIVRAILTELRDPSGAMVHSMQKAMSPGRRPTPEFVSSAEKHRIRWRAVIDRILADQPGNEKPAPLRPSDVGFGGAPF